MTAPAYAVVRGRMVREVETEPSPRLLFLLERAFVLGHPTPHIVPGGEAGELPFLSVMVRGPFGNIIGRITIDDVAEGCEEVANISVDCDAMTGLPMQADNLIVYAQLLREAFVALTGERAREAA